MIEQLGLLIMHVTTALACPMSKTAHFCNTTITTIYLYITTWSPIRSRVLMGNLGTSVGEIVSDQKSLTTFFSTGIIQIAPSRCF